jgi:hypothetical protein
VAETPTLRPLGVGEVLDAGIKLYLRHWKPLMICVVGIVLPIEILSALVVSSIDPDSLRFSFDTSSSSSNGPSGNEVGALIVLYCLTFLGILLATAACFKAVADAWLGAEPEAGRSLGFALRRLPRLVWLVIIASCCLVPAFIAFFIPGVWLSIAWSLAVPALLFERIGAFKGLARSFRLVRGRWWPIFGGVLAAYLMTLVIGIFVSFLPSAIATAIAEDNDLVNGIATVVGGTVSQMIATPYLAAVITLLYFDQRVRKEGFDLQLLAEGLGRPRDPDAPIPAPLVGPKSPPAPAPQREWWRDPAPAGPGTYGSGFEAPSSDARPPPAAETPPPASGGSWAAPSPEVPASPPPPNDEPPKPDPKRADWLPPEAPRGPGGL